MLYNYLLTAGFLLLSALFSGLTLGLMSLDSYELKRKIKLGDRNAKRVYPVRKNGNLLLCNLLLGNVAVNSALAVFLGSITSGVLAGILSTGLIVIFGEIIPQSIFSRHALALGAKTVWLVRIFNFFLYPITKPLSMALDKFLGGELPTIFNKHELKLMLEEQKHLDENKHLIKDLEMAHKTLQLSDKCVKDVMTPRINIYAIDESTKLTKKLINEIKKKGHTRIPVICKDKDKVTGILYVKDLLGKTNLTTANSVMRKKFVKVSESLTLKNVLELFKSKKQHLFIVEDQFKGTAGLITLEDVIEEIVGEIVDESDTYKDMRKLN